jgi:hypothetical protein
MLSQPLVDYPKKPERAFERAVTWLLSLIGFCTIDLSEKN